MARGSANLSLKACAFPSDPRAQGPGPGDTGRPLHGAEEALGEALRQASTSLPPPRSQGTASARLHSLGSRKKCQPGPQLPLLLSQWLETGLKQENTLPAKISKHLGEGGRAISGLVTIGTFLNQLQEERSSHWTEQPNSGLHGPTCPEGRAHTSRGSGGGFSALGREPSASVAYWVPVCLALPVQGQAAPWPPVSAALSGLALAQRAPTTLDPTPNSLLSPNCLPPQACMSSLAPLLCRASLRSHP